MNILSKMNVINVINVKNVVNIMNIRVVFFKVSYTPTLLLTVTTTKISFLTRFRRSQTFRKSQLLSLRKKICFRYYYAISTNRNPKFWPRSINRDTSWIGCSYCGHPYFNWKYHYFVVFLMWKIIRAPLLT